MKGVFVGKLLIIFRIQPALRGAVSPWVRKAPKCQSINNTENKKIQFYNWPCDKWMPSRQIQNLRKHRTSGYPILIHKFSLKRKQRKKYLSGQCENPTLSIEIHVQEGFWEFLITFFLLKLWALMEILLKITDISVIFSILHKLL